MPEETWSELKEAVRFIGKGPWNLLLLHVAELHEKSIREPRGPLMLPWEEIGPGYLLRAFGHWDIVHQVLDTLAWMPGHARNQLMNLLHLQLPDGMLPALVTFPAGTAVVHTGVTHPPVWPVAVSEYYDATGDTDLLLKALDAAERQIRWFEENRKAEDGGFYYSDIINKRWESGVDDGVRFSHEVNRPVSLVDATAHVAMLYEHAVCWCERVGKRDGRMSDRAKELREFMRCRMFDVQTGFFHDAHVVGNPETRTLSLEGFWPLVAGAASEDLRAG